MRSRICALILAMSASACAEDLTTIAYEIYEPDPPEPVYELAVLDTLTGSGGRSWGAPGEPVRFPAGGSMGWGGGEQYAGERVQICAVGRGEEDRLLGAVSDPITLIAGETVTVTMQLAALEDESEVPPQCAPALVDAGVPF